MWRRLVDSVLVVAGAALTVASGGAAAALSGALLGAGISGFQSDIMHQTSGTDDEADWGESLGMLLQPGHVLKVFFKGADFLVAFLEGDQLADNGEDHWRERIIAGVSAARQ